MDAKDRFFGYDLSAYMNDICRFSTIKMNEELIIRLHECSVSLQVIFNRG